MKVYLHRFVTVEPREHSTSRYYGSRMTFHSLKGCRFWFSLMHQAAVNTCEDIFSLLRHTDTHAPFMHPRENVTLKFPVDVWMNAIKPCHNQNHSQQMELNVCLEGCAFSPDSSLWQAGCSSDSQAHKPTHHFSGWPAYTFHKPLRYILVMAGTLKLFSRRRCIEKKCHRYEIKLHSTALRAAFILNVTICCHLVFYQCITAKVFTWQSLQKPVFLFCFSQ